MQHSHRSSIPLRPIWNHRFLQRLAYHPIRIVSHAILQNAERSVQRNRMLSAEIKFSSQSRRVARQPDIAGVKLRTQATTDADNAAANTVRRRSLCLENRLILRYGNSGRGGEKMTISLFRVFPALLLNIPPFCRKRARQKYRFPVYTHPGIVSGNVSNCSVYRVSGFHSMNERGNVMKKIEVWWSKMVEIFARPVSGYNECISLMHYLSLQICF